MRQTATGSNSASAATGIEGTSTSGGASSSGSLERSMSINNNNWTPFSLLDSNELENGNRYIYIQIYIMNRFGAFTRVSTEIGQLVDYSGAGLFTASSLLTTNI